MGVEGQEVKARRSLSKGWGIEDALSLQGAAGACSQVQQQCDFWMVARYRGFCLGRVRSGTCESVTHELPVKVRSKSGDDMVLAMWRGRMGTCCLLKSLGALGSFVLQVLESRKVSRRPLPDPICQ